MREERRGRREEKATGGEGERTVDWIYCNDRMGIVLLQCSKSTNMPTYVLVRL